MTTKKKSRVDRQFFAALLNDAAAALAERNNSESLFAAPLAARIKDLLRIRLADPDANLNGQFFGPVLYPDLSSEDQALLKFRHFLESFPEFVEVNRMPSGDKVRLLGPDEHNDIEAVDSIKTIVNSVESKNSQKATPLAYLIIDSASFLENLHVILGGVKPGPKSLPNWDQLRKYLQAHFPANEWKALFLMAVANAQGDGVEGFKGYLEAVGFQVLQLGLESQPAEMGGIIKERSRVSALAASKLLSHIATAGTNTHVFVVTHASTVATALSELLKKRQEGARIGVIGFPEHMDTSLLKLKEKGLHVVDIETEAKAFKSPLPRRQLISASDFDPAKFL